MKSLPLRSPKPISNHRRSPIIPTNTLPNLAYLRYQIPPVKQIPFKSKEAADIFSFFGVYLEDAVEDVLEDGVCREGVMQGVF